MAEFRYTALDEQGKEVTGALQAENRSAALARLKSMGMYPMGVEMAASGAAAVSRSGPTVASPEAAGPRPPLFPRRVSGADLALFTRQLAPR